jgi:hypothetical protein
MKSKKVLVNILLSFMLIMPLFLASAPTSYAQTIQDWSAPVNLSMSGAATNPVIVVDLHGTIHAIWLVG